MAEISIGIPHDQIRDIVNECINTKLRETILKDTAQLIRIVMCDPHQDRYTAERHKDHPDLSEGYHIIKELIDDHLYYGTMETFVKQYIEEHFPTALKEALDLAIKHQARKIAFAGIEKLKE